MTTPPRHLRATLETMALLHRQAVAGEITLTEMVAGQQRAVEEYHKQPARARRQK